MGSNPSSDEHKQGELESSLRINTPVPPSASQPPPRKKRFNKKTAAILVIIIAILAIIGTAIGTRKPTGTSNSQQMESQSQSSANQQTSGALAQSTVGNATVSRVIDGDTIDVQFADGRKATVRYIGIDSPESGQAYSSEAKALNESLVMGKTVRLEKEVV